MLVARGPTSRKGGARLNHSYRLKGFRVILLNSDTLNPKPQTRFRVEGLLYPKPETLKPHTSCRLCLAAQPSSEAMSLRTQLRSEHIPRLGLLFVSDKVVSVEAGSGLKISLPSSYVFTIRRVAVALLS